MRMFATLLGIVFLSLISIGAVTTSASSSTVDFEAFLPSAEDLSDDFAYRLDHSRLVTPDDVQLVVPEQFVAGSYQLFFVETDVTLDVRAPVIMSVWCLQYKTDDLAHLALVTDYVRITLNGVTPSDDLDIEQIADEAIANGGPTQGEDHGARIWFRDGNVLCRLIGIGDFYDPINETYDLAVLTANRLEMLSSR